MANLLSTLISTAGALSAYDQVLQVTQNNVANAGTPGYVKQRQSLQAMPFDPAAGLTGGVRTGDIESARNDYADQAVRRQNELLGQAQQQVNSLTSLQSAFDISGNSGIPKGLNDLFSSFSAWAQSPDDTPARQTVIDRATDLATSFQQTATQLTNAAQDAEQQAGQMVNTVNGLVTQLQGYNHLILQGDRNDAGLDAEVHSTLENLSQYVNISALQQGNGSISVLMNGQTPLLLGDQAYRISAKPEAPDSAAYPQGRPSVHILADDGTDITSATTGGQLGALLDFRNRILPSYIGDGTQQGDLNRMAQQFAERVNAVLTAGHVSEGPPPLSGIALFSYDSTDPTSVAQTLTVNPSTVKPELLGAIQPGPPYVSNGVSLELSQMSHPQNPADEIDGASYNEFFGNLAARAGNALDQANSNLQVQQSAVAQAKNLQQQMSGVSLDEEATILIQFQRAYEANARLITIMNQLTQDTINILQ